MYVRLETELWKKAFCSQGPLSRQIYLHISGKRSQRKKAGVILPMLSSQKEQNDKKVLKLLF